METLNLKYDLRHNKIIDNSPPPLFQFASIKVANCVWNGEKFVEWGSDEEHERVDRILNKISELLLPNKIKDDVALTVIVIADQLRNLRIELRNVFSKNNNYFFVRDKIHWTYQCTIDKIKTAETLANCDELDIKTRYEIAEFYFLEKEINILSVQLPKDYYRRKIGHTICDTVSWKGDIISRQYCKATYEDCFEDSLTSNDEIGGHYYWQHLTAVQKNARTIPRSYNANWNKFFLFLFTDANAEQKWKLLKDDVFCSNLLVNFLKELQWLPYWNEVLKRLPEDYLLSILWMCERKIMASRFYVHKKKLTEEFCFILRQLYELNLDPTLWDCSTDTNSITRLLVYFLNEDETNLVEMVLKSMPSTWIEKSFIKLRSTELIVFLTGISLEHGILDFIISSALSSVGARQKLLAEIEDKEMIKIIQILIENDCLYAIDKLFHDFQDFPNYKILLAEKMGFELCHEFITKMYLPKRKWELINEFVNWCYQSETDINSFYYNFVQSEGFDSLFKKDWKTRSKCIITIIRVNNLGKLFDDERIFDICIRILSQEEVVCYYKYIYCIDFDVKNVAFEAMDQLLTVYFQDNEKKVLDFKKKFFIEGSSKLCTFLPLELLLKMHQFNFEWNKECKQWNAWRALVNDFFCWISPSEEKKVKITEEFWNSEDVVHITGNNCQKKG